MAPNFPTPIPGRVFLYALCEPGSRTIRYLGQTKNPRKRFDKHLSASSQKKNHLGFWLRGVLNRSTRPEMVILRDVPESDWEQAEKRYIRIARGVGINLTNATDGGEGCNPSPEVTAKILASRSWYRPSEETKAKIGRGNRGKILSSEQILLLKRPKSSEHRAKLRAAKLGKSMSESAKQNMRKAQSNRAVHPNTGKPHSSETREKMRQSRLAYLAKPQESNVF